MSLVNLDTDGNNIVDSVIAANQNEFLNEWTVWSKEIERTTTKAPIQVSPEWQSEVMKSVAICAIDIVSKQHKCDVFLQEKLFKLMPSCAWG